MNKTTKSNKSIGFALGLVFLLAGCNAPKPNNSMQTENLNKAENLDDNDDDDKLMTISKKGIAQVYSTSQQAINASGTVKFVQENNNGLRIIANLKGLKPGEHGFHIHEFGDCSNNGEAAGSHFSPEHKNHGAPMANSEHHEGDLGNIKADQAGNAVYDEVIPNLKLHFVLGRSIVIHEKTDDFKTQPTGNSGARVACGVIGMQQ